MSGIKNLRDHLSNIADTRAFAGFTYADQLWLPTFSCGNAQGNQLNTTVRFEGDSDDGCGVVRIDQQATAGAIGRYVGSLVNPENVYPTIALPQRRPWMIAFSMRLVSGTTTATTMKGRASDIGVFGKWHIGVRGPVSTTNFVAWSTAGQIVSKVPIDDRWHTFYLANDSQKSYFRVDTEGWQAGTVYSNTLDTEGLLVENGANGGASVTDFKWVYTAYQLVF